MVKTCLVIRIPEIFIFKCSFQVKWKSFSCVRLFATPWVAARQASLSITNSRSSLKLMSIKSVMPYSHLILCRPILLLPPIPPSIRVFSNESTLHMRWPKYWSFSFSITPYKEHPGLISCRMDWLDLLQSKGLLGVFSNTTVQKHQFFHAQLSSQSSPWNSPGQHTGWVASPSPGDLPNPGIKPRSPSLQADSLEAEPQEKPNSSFQETSRIITAV